MIPFFKFRPTVEDLRERSLNTLSVSLGIQITELGDHWIKATMPVDHRTMQPMGLLHGGASVALAETLGSVGSSLYIDSPNTYPVGIEINANHIRSVSAGIVTGMATPIKIGHTLHIWNIEIRDETNELICISRLTVMLVKK